MLENFIARYGPDLAIEVGQYAQSRLLIEAFYISDE